MFKIFGEAMFKSQKFYVAQNGLQKGPWSVDEITKKISSKQLEWTDYIYDEKTEDWIHILEHPQFTQVLNSSFKNPITHQVNQNTAKAVVDVLRERCWYILKQNSNYGPFSKFEMIQMLQTRTLFEHDFVWKNGMAAWKKLADIKDFCTQEIKEIYDSVCDDVAVMPAAQEDNIFLRRRHARAQYQSQLVIHDRSRVIRGTSFEISAGGAGLIIDGTDFPINYQLNIHFQPSKEVPAFNASCTIVSKNNNRYGVRFDHVSTGVKDSISKYTKKKAA